MKIQDAVEEIGTFFKGEFPNGDIKRTLTTIDKEAEQRGMRIGYDDALKGEVVKLLISKAREEERERVFNHLIGKTKLLDLNHGYKATIVEWMDIQRLFPNEAKKIGKKLDKIEDSLTNNKKDE